MPLVLSLAAIVSKISSIAEELLAHIALAASAIDSLAADEVSLDYRAEIEADGAVASQDVERQISQCLSKFLARSQQSV